jgi:hypothetical protein
MPAAVFATFASGLRRQFMISRETALLGRRVLPTFASGISCSLRIVFEVSAAGMSASAGDFPPPAFVHRREPTVGRVGLISIRHAQPSSSVMTANDVNGGLCLRSSMKIRTQYRMLLLVLDKIYASAKA